MTETPHLLLQVSGLYAGYGRVPVLENVSLEIPDAGFVSVVGSNGAGKSTLLRTISGLIHASKGSIFFDGIDVTKQRPVSIVSMGLRHVAEGHRLFRQLAVSENLDLGLYGLRISRKEKSERLDQVFDLFPVLQRKAKHVAGVLSGGEQQMLSIGAALMGAPKLIMLDEPSLGLAPIVMDEVFDKLASLNANGTALFLVEQMVERALEIAQYAYVMQLGRVVFEGAAKDVAVSDEVRQAYLRGSGHSTWGGSSSLASRVWSDDSG